MKTLDDLKDIYQRCYDTWAKDKLTHEPTDCCGLTVGDMKKFAPILPRGGFVFRCGKVFTPLDQEFDPTHPDIPFDKTFLPAYDGKLRRDFIFDLGILTTDQMSEIMARVKEIIVARKEAIEAREYAEYLRLKEKFKGELKCKKKFLMS